jgi:hypothetical protein
MNYEEYMAIECGNDGMPPLISSFPIKWRWSDHHATEQWLEVCTVDGWLAVYPIISRQLPALAKHKERSDE